MPSQGYRPPKPNSRPILVTSGHRVCLYVEEDTFRRLKSKLAMEGMTMSEWMRGQIAAKLAK